MAGSIQLFGGGVIRVRPDGTGLEIVSTGERNPLSVALSATDEVFTYGNDDDSKKWPNSLTHHIVGGHYGYPYQFLTAPHRALPIMAGDFRRVGCPGNLLQRRWSARRVPRQSVLLRLGPSDRLSVRDQEIRRNVCAVEAHGHWYPREASPIFGRSRSRSRRTATVSGWSTGRITAGWRAVRVPAGSIGCGTPVRAWRRRCAADQPTIWACA